MAHTGLAVGELFSGAGGMLLGLQRAGFAHSWLFDNDPDSVETVRRNRPGFLVYQADVRRLNAADFPSVDLLAGGMPLAKPGDRSLQEAIVKAVAAAEPSALMLEFALAFTWPQYRRDRFDIDESLRNLGYTTDWRRMQAADFGVAQDRVRLLLVAFRRRGQQQFVWPVGSHARVTVGDALAASMGSLGWRGAERWARDAQSLAPTVVGGSKLHGGPDLGPAGTKEAWIKSGVDPTGIADYPPKRDSPLMLAPRLTIPMLAILQGFDDDWSLYGGKTSRFRQLASASPPPMIEALGSALRDLLSLSDKP